MLYSLVVSGGLSTVRGVLSATLPRAYDDSPLGVQPVDKEEHIVGTSVNIEGISAASSHMKDRLQQEVLRPIEQWLAAYHQTKVGLTCQHQPFWHMLIFDM